jgi:serine/threonine-protein kinase ATR
MLDSFNHQGLNLPKAEVIPFRLTSNIIDAFGPTGADGVYSGSLKDAMTTLRDNRDTLLSVLEPFLKDPIIDWKRTRSQQQQKIRASGGAGIVAASTQDRQTKEAKRSIHVIDERLRGIYNLHNPNHKKIRRADGTGATASVTDDQEHDEMTQLMPLSVPGQVHKMIAEATSSENLVQLFVGWMPWV